MKSRRGVYLTPTVHLLCISLPHLHHFFTLLQRECMEWTNEEREYYWIIPYGNGSFDLIIKGIQALGFWKISLEKLSTVAGKAQLINICQMNRYLLNEYLCLLGPSLVCFFELYVSCLTGLVGWAADFFPLWMSLAKRKQSSTYGEKRLLWPIYRAQRPLLESTYSGIIYQIWVS